MISYTLTSLLINGLVSAKPLDNKEEQDRIAQVLSTSLNLPTLASVNSDLNLHQVALTGQNEGGLDINPKHLHTVTSGETLSGIAALYNLHSGSLVLANPWLKDTELLHEGEQLSIPSHDATPEELAKEHENRIKQASVIASTPQVVSKSTNYVVPVNYSYISQGFSAYHTGIDMVASIGSPVVAAHSGCVVSVASGWNGGYGRMIVLDHGGGISSLYAHLSGFMVTKGCVDAGDIIGYSGNTGRSTGPHLHFEIRKGGIPVNPAKYVY